MQTEVVTKQPEPQSEQKMVETKRENMEMLLAGLSGSDNLPKLTTEQVDRVLSDRSKLYDYIHADKKDDFELSKIDKRNNLHYLYVGVGAVILLSLLVLKFKPEYFSQLLQAIVTTLGGSLGGYGFGKYQGKKDAKKED